MMAQPATAAAGAAPEQRAGRPALPLSLQRTHARVNTKLCHTEANRQAGSLDGPPAGPVASVRAGHPFYGAKTIQFRSPCCAMSRRSSFVPEALANTPPRGGPAPLPGSSTPTPPVPRPWLARAKDAVTLGDAPALTALLAPKFAEQAFEAVRAFPAARPSAHARPSACASSSTWPPRRAAPRPRACFWPRRAGGRRRAGASHRLCPRRCTPPPRRSQRARATTRWRQRQPA